jgi:ATP synthase protein I
MTTLNGYGSMDESDRKSIRTVGQVSSLGLLLLVSMALGFAAGDWLDGKLGTQPWLAFGMTVLGLVAGIYESARILVKITRDIDK